MNWVDLAVLGLLIVSGLLAFVRGLARELLGLGAWIGAIFVGVWALPRVQPQFEKWLGNSIWVLPIAFVAVFVASLIVLMIVLMFVGRWVSGILQTSLLGGLDRTLGMLFGLVRGAVIVVLAYMIVGWLVKPAQWPEVVRESRSIGIAYTGAHWLWEHRPPGLVLWVEPEAPPARLATADAVLRANPRGRALDR